MQVNQLKGDGKASIEDFNKILDCTTYAEPRVIEDASKMLEAVSKTAVKLASDHPCIALIGYTQAATLMSKMDQEILENMDCIDQFLVQLLHKIDREVQLAFRAIYKQVVWAQSSALHIDKSIISTLCDQIDTIFNQILRNQVSDFHLPVELENNSTREILKDGDELPATPNNKRKREDNTPTRNYKQKKDIKDLWALLEGTDFNSIFGDHPNGNALLAKLLNFKFQHHQKTGRSFRKTPLCIPFAAGQPCFKGKECPKNHSFRKTMRGVRGQRDDLLAVDSLFTNQYKWQLPSVAAPIILAPKISSTGVTTYPNSLSPTVVVTKRCCTHIGQPGGVPSREPSN